MARRQEPGAELRGIVRANEEIKKVAAMAGRVGLMAMNAIFLAKRAGRSALGFGVLANELRSFALDLERQMNLLRDMTGASVGAVTTLLRRAHTDRLLERTRDEARGAGCAIVERLMRARAERFASGEQEHIAAMRRHLDQAIAGTAQLVEMGGVLARSAKIEAAYGGPYSAALMQVSGEFERAIHDIQHSLQALAKQRDASP